MRWEDARSWTIAQPFESQARLAILLGSLLAATVGIAVLLTARQLEPDST